MCPALDSYVVGPGPHLRMAPSAGLLGHGAMGLRVFACRLPQMRRGRGAACSCSGPETTARTCRGMQGASHARCR